MVDFKFIQCKNPACALRMPIDLDQFSGKYCPRCGESAKIVEDTLTNQDFDIEIPSAKRSLTLILDNIRSAYNVGAIFRTADGIGVRKLYLCGITPNPNQSEGVVKTALGAERLIPWEYQPNGLMVARDLRAKGLNLIALERTADAQLINDYRPDPIDKRGIALVLGNEKVGVDPGILNLCDKVLSLPMMGKKASLNVAVAFGAAAYWLSFI